MTDETGRSFQRDLNLARAAFHGDPGARLEFARRMACVPRFLNARNRRAGNPLAREELMDLAQDVQLTVWSKLADYAGQASLESWVFRFCHLRMLRYLEKRNRRQAVLTLSSDAVLTRAPSQEDVAGHGDEREHLVKLLRYLAPREAEVTRLKFLENLEFDEIAGQLGISKSSVKTHCYRALEKIRQVLAPLEGGSAKGGSA